MSRILLFALIGGSLLLLSPPGSHAVPEGIKLTWPGGGEGMVVFDGTKHAQKGLNCDACHVKGGFQTKKDSFKMNMNSLEREQYCGACHNGKKAFGIKDPKNCHTCHQGKKGR